MTYIIDLFSLSSGSACHEANAPTDDKHNFYSLLFSLLERLKEYSKAERTWEVSLLAFDDDPGSYHPYSRVSRILDILGLVAGARMSRSFSGFNFEALTFCQGLGSPSSPLMQRLAFRVDSN
jgi:hypothetical protein